MANCMKNWCRTKCLASCVGNWCSKKCLGNCMENWCWKKCRLRRRIIVLYIDKKHVFQENYSNTELLWLAAGCIVGTFSQFGEKANITLFIPFQWNHHMPCRILMNCRNLCALTHVGKMSRFTHFAGHKISAAGHFQLFCTPANDSDVCQKYAIKTKKTQISEQTLMIWVG